jgi:hypothetical protein
LARIPAAFIADVVAIAPNYAGDHGVLPEPAAVFLRELQRHLLVFRRSRDDAAGIVALVPIDADTRCQCKSERRNQ